MRTVVPLVFFVVLLGASTVLAQVPEDPNALQVPQTAAPAPPASAAAPYPVAPAAEQAPPPGPMQAPPPAPLQAYPGPPIGFVPVGRGVTEAEYSRNRAFAIAGKVLTAIAPLLFLGGVVATIDEPYDTYPPELVALALSAYFVGAAGRLTWAGSDLKMTNRLVENGVRVRRGAAIGSMVMASLSCIPYATVVASPTTWILGSIASARIREATDLSGPQHTTVAPYSMQTRRGFSAGFTLKF